MKQEQVLAEQLFLMLKEKRNKMNKITFLRDNSQYKLISYSRHLGRITFPGTIESIIKPHVLLEVDDFLTALSVEYFSSVKASISIEVSLSYPKKANGWYCIEYESSKKYDSDLTMLKYQVCFKGKSYSLPICEYYFKKTLGFSKRDFYFRVITD